MSNSAPLMASLVQFKNSPIHGTGGFASQSIPKGSRIIEYVGEKIDRAETLRRCEANNEYLFYLDENFHLDGSVSWNPARFLNHSCAPNAEAAWQAGLIWIVSLRAIPAGEEITFNYCYDLEDYRDYPCRCGSLDCVGYIVAEEYFSLLRLRHQVSDTSLQEPGNQPPARSTEISS